MPCSYGKREKNIFSYPDLDMSFRKEGTKLNTNIQREMDTHNIIIEFNGKDLEHKSKNSLFQGTYSGICWTLRYRAG